MSNKYQYFYMKTDEQLWYEVSENLSELSRRDKFKFKVTATPESLKDKLKKLAVL